VGGFLAVDGDTAALVSWGAVKVVTGDGVAHEVATEIAQEVGAVKARDGRVYAVTGAQGNLSLAVIDLSTRRETRYPVSDGARVREIAVTGDEVARRRPSGARIVRRVVKTSVT
jgi:hypothetical protein